MEGLLRELVPAEDFVIRRVEYYFHHWVFTADYLTPNVYAPRADWEKELKGLREERIGEREIWRQIRRQAYLDDAETKLNQHPIVFIGGDNRGLQQLISSSTRLGRASHGSYPFPGLYKDVGPGHTGELVSTSWDVFRRAPDSAAAETNVVVRFDNPERLEIIPDWERVLPLVRTDALARRKWAWLVLPIRFGYPATRSSFAGIVRYAETGNTSVVAPTYNGGWNRAGAASGYDNYVPHRLSSYFPASQQDNYRTGWGFLNLTIPTLVTLPPFDIAYRLLTAPVRAADRHSYPAFFRSEDVPFRFVGVTAGVSSFKIPEGFLNLAGFPEIASPFLQKAIALGGASDSFNIDVIHPSTEHVSPRYYGVTLFLGRRFTSENTVRHSNGEVRGRDREHAAGPISADAQHRYVGIHGEPALQYRVGERAAIRKGRLRTQLVSSDRRTVQWRAAGGRNVALGTAARLLPQRVAQYVSHRWRSRVHPGAIGGRHRRGFSW